MSRGCRHILESVHTSGPQPTGRQESLNSNASHGTPQTAGGRGEEPGLNRTACYGRPLNRS
jgi:hypothetical protein